MHQAAAPAPRCLRLVPRLSAVALRGVWAQGPVCALCCWLARESRFAAELGISKITLGPVGFIYLQTKMREARALS